MWRALSNFGNRQGHEETSISGVLFGFEVRTLGDPGTGELKSSTPVWFDNPA
jgi:hypothetical protein